MKAKGDKASYAFANPTAKVVGAMYKQKAGLQSVEVAYRTGAEFLNDLSSGTIDYAIPDNVQAMAQERAGTHAHPRGRRRRTHAGGAGIPTLTELGYPMDVRSWWAAFVPAATPQADRRSAQRLVQPGGRDREAKKFLDGIASDPWVTKPDEAQAYFARRSSTGASTCGSPRSSRRATGVASTRSCCAEVAQHDGDARGPILPSPRQRRSRSPCPARRAG